jgi:hypothetical protein
MRFYRLLFFFFLRCFAYRQIILNVIVLEVFSRARTLTHLSYFFLRSFTILWTVMLVAQESRITQSIIHAFLSPLVFFLSSMFCVSSNYSARYRTRSIFTRKYTDSSLHFLTVFCRSYWQRKIGV